MFEDRIVTLVENDSESSYSVKGRVVLMEEGIGCTIVADDNPDDYILCLKLPLSTKWKGSLNNENVINATEKVMEYIKECIEGDKNISYYHIRNIVFIKSGQEIGRCPTSETCAFSV